MANVRVNEAYLTGIANAIRRKNGLSDTYLPSEMEPAIDAIEGGNSNILDSLVDGTLTELNSSAITIKNYGIYACSNLVTVNTPYLTTIGQYGFGFCPKITTLDFPLVTNIANQAFYNDILLETLILRANQVCVLGGTSVFNYSKIKAGTGYTYVPSSLVDSYKIATNWVAIAAQIRAIEDYPEITGG